MSKKLPDYLKRKNYAYTKDLSLRGWAWEALRRNLDYREAYQDFLIEAETYKKKYGAKWDQIILEHVPAKKKGESLHGWRARIFMEGGKPRELNLSGKYAQEFHLLQMHDPAQKYSPEISFVSEISTFLIEQYDQLHERIPVEVDLDDENAPSLVGSGVAVIVFDQTRSFPSQIDEAKELFNKRKKELEAKEKQTLKKNKKLWLRHIRALDALYGNETFTSVEWEKFFASKGDFKHPDRAGGDIKKTARKFPLGYLNILRGYYSE